MRTTFITIGAVAVLALAGCGGGDDAEADEDSEEVAQEAEEQEVEPSQCEEAVEFLAESNNDEEYQQTHTFEAVDEAILACPDFESFQAATNEHPDALDGTDAETLVANRCEHGEEVSDAPICDDM